MVAATHTHPEISQSYYNSEYCNVQSDLWIPTKVRTCANFRHRCTLWFCTAHCLIPGFLGLWMNREKTDFPTADLGSDRSIVTLRLLEHAIRVSMYVIMSAEHDSTRVFSRFFRSQLVRVGKLGLGPSLHGGGGEGQRVQIKAWKQIVEQFPTRRLQARVWRRGSKGVST